MIDGYETLRGGLIWSEDAEDIYFVRKEGANNGRRTLYRWNVVTDRVRRVLTTDDWLSDCVATKAHFICFRDTPTYPRTVVSLDPRDGSLRTVADPNPGFRRFLLAPVERFEWRDHLGHAT